MKLRVGKMKCTDCGYSLDCPSCFGKSEAKPKRKKDKDLSWKLVENLMFKAYDKEWLEKFRSVCEPDDVSDLVRIIKKNISESQFKELREYVVLAKEKGTTPSYVHPMSWIMLEKAIEHLDSDSKGLDDSKGCERGKKAFSAKG